MLVFGHHLISSKMQAWDVSRGVIYGISLFYLPDGFLKQISNGFRESLAESGGRARLEKAVLDNPPVVHPVIRTHPESGKRVIFVNALFTTHIVGLPKDESKAILGFLFEHIQTAEFTCRFSWDVNCIAIWDNRSTQHKPINDYFPAHRCLERIVIDGDKPY